MTTEQPRRKRGGQPMDPSVKKRRNLTFRTRDDLRDELERLAAASFRSVSEEIEFRLRRDIAGERAAMDAGRLLAEAKQINAEARAVHVEARAARTAAYVQALRQAGIAILREISGAPTRVVIDLATLTAEADGIARGLRSGFTDDQPAPAAKMSAEEEARLLAELADMRERNQTMAEQNNDEARAAPKSDDDDAVA